MVRVRWRDGMSDAERSAAETRLGLGSSPDSEPDRGDYFLLDDSRSNIQRLVRDPDVEDTAGVDRSSSRAPMWPMLVRHTRLLRLRVAPWLKSPRNAETWLYDLFLLVPLLTVGLAWCGKRGGRVPWVDVWKALALAVLCVMMLLFLVRGNLDSRLSDVAAPCFLLLAWTLALTTAWSRRQSRWVRGSVVAGVLVVGLLTWGSLGVVSPEGPDQLAAIFYNRASNVPSALGRILETQTGQRLIDEWAPPGSVGINGLTRWLHECTAPSDRILVMGYHPQVVFYAERPFAAGMVVAYSDYFTEPASQRHALSRLRQESVPVVITDSPRRLDEQYTLIGEYLGSRFRLVAESEFGGSQSYQVLVDTSRRSVRTVQLAGVSLPCFVPAL